jgi:hypothetical protein
VSLDGDGHPGVIIQFVYGMVFVLDGRTGQSCWSKMASHNRYHKPFPHPSLISVGPNDQRALLLEIDKKYQAVHIATGQTVKTWPENQKLAEVAMVPWPADGPRNADPMRWRWAGVDKRDPKDSYIKHLCWNTPDGPPELLSSPEGIEMTYSRTAIPAGEADEPLTYDFSGIDPRLSVPLPWVAQAREQWLLNLGVGLACLAWMLVLPAVTMWWQFDWTHELLAEERRDWAGWYWFWPYRPSLWGCDALESDLLVAGAVWLVLWALWRGIKRFRQGRLTPTPARHRPGV